MTVHYAKQIKEPNEEYKTWFWEDDDLSPDYGWNKCNIPIFSCGEVAGGKTCDELINVSHNNINDAKHWIKISNEEDLIFVEKEEKAFNSWRVKNYKDIIKHL